MMGIPHLGGHQRAQDLSPGTDGGVAALRRWNHCEKWGFNQENADLT
jgi:hypothetical protein